MRISILLIAAAVAVPGSAEELVIGPPMEEVQRITAAAPVVDGYKVYESETRTIWWYANVRVEGATVLARVRVKPDGSGQCGGYLPPSAGKTASQ